MSHIKCGSRSPSSYRMTWWVNLQIRRPNRLKTPSESSGCGPHDRPPTPSDDAAVLGRVQGLRCAPPPLRGAPRAPWTRSPRGSRTALIVGGRSVSSNGNGALAAQTARDVLGADRLLGQALLERCAREVTRCCRCKWRRAHLPEGHPNTVQSRFGRPPFVGDEGSCPARRA